MPINLSNITYNSATISFPNTESQLLNLHVFTNSSEDTIVFTENFAGFPITDLGNNISSALVALNLPSTYTIMEGCKARNLYSTNGDSCYFNTYGQFFTPFLDLSKSNGEYRIRFSIKNNQSAAQTFYISVSDSNENFISTSSFTINANSYRIYDAIFTNGGIKSKIKFYSNTSSNIVIDDISISYPSITNTTITSSPYSTTTSSINLTNLTPNTIYNCFIEGRTDTISFRTLERIIIKNANDVSPNTAIINFNSSDNTSQRKLILIQKSNSQTQFADDLFISEYTCAETYNRAIEIYNGTGKDICLEDYSVRFNINGTYDRFFYFSQYDTIKSNTCIVLMELLEKLNVSNSGIFYTNNKLIYPTTVDGNDAIAILKNGEIIDVFGCLGEVISNGWTATDIQTHKTTLRRKSNIRSGVKVNPTIGFPTLATEWTQIGDVGSYSSAVFANFGKHTMDNAIDGFDSLSHNINLGLNDTSYYLDNLQENTAYEAYIVIGSGTDSVVSNKVTFKTGINTQRIGNGDWNDSLWSKGIPTKDDNAIILNAQKLSIPNGVNAKCYNLIIKDTLNQIKASFINNGNLDIQNKAIVEAYFNGYTSNDNGWNLFGLPISAASSSQDLIGEIFFHTGENDDLYYWQEDYTDTENKGRWINWKDIPASSGAFFKDTRGYLVSYEQNTQLRFTGELNDNPAYTLLNNASLSSPATERGWHLCSNPYPFYIKMSQVQRTNVSLPSILNPVNSNYTPLLLTDSIAPFRGFMVQVGNPSNELTITKTEGGAKSTNIANVLTLKAYSNSGSDITRIVFMDSTSMGYDIEYDNRKLHGLALSPEISTKIGSESFSINAIPNVEDSVIIDINFLSKKDDIYSIELSIDNAEEFLEISLYDKQTNTLLKNFKTDSTAYTFQCDSANNIDKFQLKLYKTLAALSEVELDENISIKKLDNEVLVFSNSKIKRLELINMRGQSVKKTINANSIKIPSKGIFILQILTKQNQCQKKIIHL